LINIIRFYYLHFPLGGVGEVYLAEDEDSKRLFILDDSALALGSALPNLKENEGTDPKENEGN
jgi:hypothetical protein